MQGERVQQTALESALERIGERWTLLVVDALLEGPKRFNELQTAVPGIAPNILSGR
ncbi:MAG: winged helix-turn-helix transcriptional regulator, partial [Actinomycetota bacterium]